MNVEKTIEFRTAFVGRLAQMIQGFIQAEIGGNIKVMLTVVDLDRLGTDGLYLSTSMNYIQSIAACADITELLVGKMTEADKVQSELFARVGVKDG